MLGFVIIISSFFCIRNFVAKSVYYHNVMFVGLNRTYQQACSMFGFGSMQEKKGREDRQP
jgi:hypothetical protein